MKVEIVTLAAGPQGVRQVGQVLDVPPDEAKDLIAGGYARAAGPPDPEADVAAASEADDASEADAAPRRRRRRRETAAQPEPPETAEAGGASASKG